MVNVAYGQTATNTEARDSSNIYYQALRTYVNNIPTKNDGHKTVLLIEKNPIVTKSLPIELDTYQFEYLEGYEVDKRLKSKNPITLIRIVPLQLKKGIFFISIIPFTVTRENGKVNYSNSGGDKIVFEFDCANNAFHFKEIRHGNI